MEYKLKLLEAGKWQEACDNLLVNKILRHINRPAVLSNLNTIMNNIRSNEGKFEEDQSDITLTSPSNNNINNESKDEEEEKADIMTMETPQQPPAHTVNHTVHASHTRDVNTNTAYVHTTTLNNKRQDKFNQQKAQFLASQGKYHKAIMALESQGLCPNTKEYRQRFASKLVPANGIIHKPFITTAIATEVTFQYTQIQQVTQLMDHTSGAGSDGMKIRYLKQMMYNINDIPELMNNIGTFLNDMAQGKLAPFVAQHMRHSRAINGKKLKKEYVDPNAKIVYDQ